MLTENIQTLKIHKLTQEQYNRELENGTLDKNALYLTPDKEIDLSPYATIEQLNSKADSEHTHNDIYYTETEVDVKFEEVDSALNEKADVLHNHNIDDINSLQSALDAKVSTNITVNGKSLSSDIVLSASDIGADVSGSSSSALENAKEYANDLASGKADLSHTHNDIYYTESEIDEKVSAINTSISNVVDGTIVVAKANHASNADNATNAVNAEKSIQDASGNIITSTYETKVDAASKLTEAKSYADGIKSELLNGAGAAYDTLKELGDLIDDNTDAIDALEIVAAGKQATITGAATTITANNLTTNRALVSNSSGKVAVSDITSDELEYLDGVTSNIQTQLNGKADSSHNHSASNINSGTLSSNRLPTVPITKGGTGATTAAAALTNLGITATATELNYCDGVTSNIQTQISNIRQIPSCTSNDNGKFLCVVNGVATWTDVVNGDEVDY